MKNKVIVGFLSAALVTGGGFYTYSNHVEAVESKRVETQQTETITDIQKRVDKLFSNSKKEFLSKGINFDQIQVIKKDLENQEGKGFTTDNAVKLNTAIMELSDAENMLQLQTLVLSLLDQKGVLVENAAISKASEKASNLKGIKPAFADQQFKVINLAKQQDVQLKDATKKVQSLFINLQQKKVRPGLNQKELDTTKKIVLQIKQEKTKKNLTDLLNVVDQELKKREEAVKLEKAVQNKQTESSLKQPSINESKSSTVPSSTSPNKSKNQNTTNKKSPQKSNGDSTVKKNTPKSSSKDSWDTVGEQLENKDWEHVGSGYVDGENGNTWDEYE